MKKTLAITIMMAVVMTALVPASYAGVVDSRHDMTGATAYATLQAFADYGACSACHIPHGAQGQRLFPNVGVTPAGASVLGFFGPLCQTCHDNSIPGGSTNIWTNDTALQGHGLDISALQAVDADEQVAASLLPYTTGDANGDATLIECLSCHDVHNTTPANGRPFMAAPLDNLCESCHTNRVNNDVATTGYANAAGIHPAGTVFTGDVGNGVATNAGNSPFVAGWGTEFVQNVDVGTDGSTWTDLPWNSGMQLSGQGAAGTGGVDCISCHNVHYDEDNPAGTPAGNSTIYLGIVNHDLAGNGANNDFCEYCHQGAAMDLSYGYTAVAGIFPNPGGTGFTHPNDDLRANNTAVQAAVDWNWQPTTPQMLGGTGSSASWLYCTSCHGVHPNTIGGATETMPATPVLLNYGAAINICEACHATAGFQHHPVGGTYATAGSNVGQVTCNGGDIEGYQTCHGSAAGGNGTIAHNRIDQIGSPGTPGQRCQPCHTNNPGTYALTQAGGVPYTAGELASHFVGDAAALTFNNIPTTRAAAADPIRYAGTGLSNDGGAVDWAGSAMPSLFGASATDFICESCHRLAAGNVQSGDGTTALLVEVSGSAIATVASTATGAAAYTAAPYICTGCHLVPGGTHPLEDGDGTQYPAAGWTTDQGQSYNTNTTLNCESCHSPHNAATDGGQYILDGSTAADYRTPAGGGMDWEPAIDYTAFCAVCHSTFQ